MQAKRPAVDPGYRDCIVFSAAGYQPLPDMMAGGDLDGDTFWVSWNPLIIPDRDDEPDPRVPEPKALMLCRETDPIQAMREHLASRLGMCDVGMAANAWEKAAEAAALGVRDPYAIAYFKRYEVFLDVNKAGTEIPSKPSQTLKGPSRLKGPIATLRECISEKMPALGQSNSNKLAELPPLELDHDLVPSDLFLRPGIEAHQARCRELLEANRALYPQIRNMGKSGKLYHNARHLNQKSTAVFSPGSQSAFQRSQYFGEQ